MGVRSEHLSPSWGIADLLGVGWEADVVYDIAPYLNKERLIDGGGKPERDASRVRKHVFLCIDGRMLGLLCISAP